MSSNTELILRKILCNLKDQLGFKTKTNQKRKRKKNPIITSLLITILRGKSKNFSSMQGLLISQQVVLTEYRSVLSQN